MKEGFKLSKIEEVRTAMYAAMKAKDKERKDALSMLLGALKAKAIDKREDLTEKRIVLLQKKSNSAKIRLRCLLQTVQILSTSVN